MHTKRTRILAGFGIVLLTLVLGYLLIRPIHLRWGASDEDLARAMPGDLPGARWTRAILIEATPEQIWPWLLQWGQGRGGWYSYDWLENLLGFDIHTASSILPEFQDPQIGTPICMSGSFCPSAVHIIEPYQWFGWQAQDDKGQPVWTFVFGLFPVNETSTRLVVRESFDPVFMPAPAALAIEIPDVVMELKALDTVKQRAEGRPVSNWIFVYEIAAWLTVFAASLAAGVQYLTRPAWKLPLALVIAGLSILLALTFLFPPLWLRGVLAIGLLAGLGWSFQLRTGATIPSTSVPPPPSSG